ncbi:TIGR01671 family protein [Streptococcus infantis SK970]|nr:TIGR01671 family protein [Streptococcus infantis SK970]
MGWRKKEMFKDTFAITESGQVVVVEQEFVTSSPDYVFVDHLVIMQSTGVKDLKGIEIFEGDIVRVLDSTYTVFYDNERGSYRLKPHDDRWNVDYMSNFSHGGNFEVVGNIYENPEWRIRNET